MNGDNSLEKQILAKYGGDVKRVMAVLETLSRTPLKTKQKHNYGDTVILLQDVVKTYKVGSQKVSALNGVSLDIKQGEYVALTGPSGSGKSTLLQIIGALDKQSTGKISVNGSDISRMSDRKLSEFRNKSIGFVFQFFYLQPFLSLEKNLEVPGMFSRLRGKMRRERSASLARAVGLEERLKHLPNELSGGQMQRAAIARALLNQPKILLADEPTGNLDRENAFAIMDLFEKIRSEFGTTIVVVTHDQELASRTDREITLRDGVIV